MDIVTGLAAASHALDIAKRIRELNEGIKNSELKLQMAELYDQLTNIRLALADAKNTILAKDEEIARLKAHNNAKTKTLTLNGYQFGIGEDGVPFPRAFCPNCLQAHGTQSQLTRGKGASNICPACRSDYPAKITNIPRDVYWSHKQEEQDHAQPPS